MKNIFYILLLLPTFIFAQYPANANQKITLGEQTTADGLVYRGVASIDTVTATSKITRTNKQDTSAFLLLDTVTNLLWHYKIGSNAWIQAGGGVSVTSFSAGTTGLTPSTATTGAVTLGGTLAVANGGTGQTTLAAAGINTGSGTLNYLPKYTATGTTLGNSLIFDNASSVGINTTTPLVVNGNTAAGTGIDIYGNGISTSVIDGSIASQFLFNERSQVADSRLFRLANISGYFSIVPMSDALSKQETGLVVNRNGNVGIGTASPTARLHVKGSGVTSSTTALKVDNSGNTNLLTVLDNGNVGIGTTSPYGKFEIASLANNYSTAPAITLTDLAGNANSNRWIVGNIATDYGSFNIVSAPTPSSTTWTPRITITKDGNVGIGTTSPGYKLDVVTNKVMFGADNGSPTTRTTATPKYGSIVIPHYTNTELPVTVFYGYAGGDRNGITFGGGNGDENSATYISFFTGATYITPGGTERMRIISNGNVGIGTTSPVQNLHVASSGISRILIQNTANASTGAGLQMLVTSGETQVGNGTIRTDNSDNMQFFNLGGERMRITSGGNVIINSLTTNGIVYSNAGTLTNTNPSDSTLKNSINPYTYGLSEILQLKPKTFYYNLDVTRSHLKYGFIAQEVQSIMPNLVRIIGNGSDKLGLESEGIYVAMVNAIKELSAEIDILKQEIINLKNK